MTTITFDKLAYSQALQDAGIEKRHADAIVRAQKDALDEMVSTKELATKTDIQELHLEIEKIRTSVEKTKFDMLKWQIAIGIAIITLMAKGFNWIGF